MNTLFYGTDTAKLIEKQNQLKSSGCNYFRGDINLLYNEYHSNGLFGTNAGLIVDSETIDITEITKLLLNKGQVDINYFHFDSINKPTFIKLFDKNFNFKIEDDKTIFAFLDSLFSFDTKKTLSSIKKFSKDEDKIFLVAMIFFNIKNLCLFYLDKPAFYKLNPYVSRKIETLASKIDFPTTKKILSVVAEADYKIKVSADKESVLYSTILFISGLKQ